MPAYQLYRRERASFVVFAEFEAENDEEAMELLAPCDSETDRELCCGLRTVAFMSCGAKPVWSAAPGWTSA